MRRTGNVLASPGMSVPFIQACTNGRLHSAQEPSITPLNRGFLYGDAVYEVWRTYHGVLFAWASIGRGSSVRPRPCT